MPQSAEIVSVSATITSIVKKPDGVIEVYFSDGVGLNFESLDQMVSYFMDIQDSWVAKKLLIAWWVARSSDISNTNVVLNKTLTFDLNNANPIRVQ